MQNKDFFSYSAPTVEVIVMLVEGCLASSLEDPKENPEIDW